MHDDSVPVAASPTSARYFDDRPTASGQAVELRSRSMRCRNELTSGKARGHEVALQGVGHRRVSKYPLRYPDPCAYPQLGFDLGFRQTGA